jgi:hypothetical protein
VLLHVLMLPDHERAPGSASSKAIPGRTDRFSVTFVAEGIRRSTGSTATVPTRTTTFPQYE